MDVVYCNYKSFLKGVQYAMTLLTFWHELKSLWCLLHYVTLLAFEHVPASYFHFFPLPLAFPCGGGMGRALKADDGLTSTPARASSLAADLGGDTGTAFARIFELLDGSSEGTSSKKETTGATFGGSTVCTGPPGSNFFDIGNLRSNPCSSKWVLVRGAEV